MIKINSLNNETGKFILSNYGQYDAFMFSGDASFLERIENFCINYGINGKGDFYTFDESTRYCLTPLERLKKALLDNFRNELMAAQPISTMTEDGWDISYDLQVIERQAIELANDFFENKLAKDNILNKVGEYQATYSESQIEKSEESE